MLLAEVKGKLSYLKPTPKEHSFELYDDLINAAKKLRTINFNNDRWPLSPFTNLATAFDRINKQVSPGVFDAINDLFYMVWDWRQFMLQRPTSDERVPFIDEFIDRVDDLIELLESLKRWKQR